MNVKKLQPKGVSSVEMLVGISIAALILIFSGYSITLFVNSAHVVAQKTQALYLAEDGLELVRFVRDNNWTNISSKTVNTTYYLNVTSSAVNITSTPETIGSFSRNVRFQNVYRHATTDDIVASTTPGSVADTNAKYVFVTVTWGSPQQRVSLTSLLVNMNP